MTTRFGISFTQPADVQLAETMLVKFGDATKCTVVAGGGSSAGVVADIADHLVPQVQDAINAANAGFDSSRVFSSFKVEPAVA